MNPHPLRRRCGGADFLGFYSTWWYLSSKTHSKINILKGAVAFGVKVAPLFWAWTSLHARSDEVATKSLRSCNEVATKLDPSRIPCASPASPHPSIKESTKGGGRRRRPPPFVEAARSAASSIWVSPWVRVRVFGTPGQRCVVLPMSSPMGLSPVPWNSYLVL